MELSGSFKASGGSVVVHGSRRIIFNKNNYQVEYYEYSIINPIFNRYVIETILFSVNKIHSIVEILYLTFQEPLVSYPLFDISLRSVSDVY